MKSRVWLFWLAIPCAHARWRVLVSADMRAPVCKGCGWLAGCSLVCAQRACAHARACAMMHASTPGDIHPHVQEHLHAPAGGPPNWNTLSPRACAAQSGEGRVLCDAPFACTHACMHARACMHPDTNAPHTAPRRPCCCQPSLASSTSLAEELKMGVLNRVISRDPC